MEWMELLAPRSKVHVEPEGLEFHAVVRRTSPRLFRLALRLTGNDADASDVLQEGYLRAFRAIGRLRGRPSAELDAWLYLGSIGFTTTISTRRLSARPSALSLLATGRAEPNPRASIRSPGTPSVTR